MTALLHGPLPLFILQAALIIALSRVVGLFVTSVNQPMVIAEIVAGMILGPSLLGVVSPKALEALFPSSSMPLLGMVSQIGLVLFMFLVGLELNPKLLHGRAHASILISHTSIIVPCLLGILLGLHVYPRLAPPGVPFTSFVLFMGVAMSITAFPVLARILIEHRLLKTKVGAVTIACAAVDDVTAWCLLAFVVSVAKATHIRGAAFTVGLALVYISAMLFLVRPTLLRLGSLGSNREAITQNLVAVTLLVLLASSFTTELIGIHALFGAFMVGAVMPKDGQFGILMAEKIEDVVVVFLLPMFFAYSGLRTRLGLLNTGEAWINCGLIILVACVGKFGGSAVAGRITKLSWREASAVGILMNTRGLMELIVLNIGLDLKVISPALFTMMVIMALVTTFMTTPLLKLVYPAGELEDEQAAALAGENAEHDGTFTVLMCVGVDRAGPALATLTSALCADRSRPHRLYALRLVQPGNRTSFCIVGHDEDSCMEGLEPLMERVDRLELSVTPIAFIASRPAQEIAALASSKKADLVLLGWQGSVGTRTVLTGTVVDVLKNVRTDVSVLIDRGLESIKRVLVPFEGTRDDKAVLALARRMADANAEVTILQVIGPGRLEQEQSARLQQIERTLAEVGPWKQGSVHTKMTSHQNGAAAAVDEASRGYDLMMVGAGHRWGLAPKLFGLVPSSMVAQCPISLLLVRHSGR